MGPLVRVLIFLELACSFSINAGDLSGQALVDYMAEHLEVTYEVKDNFQRLMFTHEVQMVLTNDGDRPIPPGLSWQMYLCPLRAIFPSQIRPNGTDIANGTLTVRHIDGCLHEITPTSQFPGLLPDEPLIIDYRAQFWSVTKYDMLPNWYVTAEGAQPATINSSTSRDLDFVKPFERKEQWKRQPGDRYDPFTPQTRLDHVVIHDRGGGGVTIVPVPMREELSSSESVNIDADWMVVALHDEVLPEGRFLAGALGLDLVNSSTEISQVILLDIDLSFHPNEHYLLDIHNDSISIQGASPRAVRHGIQSLLALHDCGDDGAVALGTIEDEPRFTYRGMHIDVVRHFFPKEEIFRLLDIMSSYKLNTLHLHLTDDEGWRVEIEGIEELTEVGGRRCHDLHEQMCIVSQLGSGPDVEETGSGFYSIADYRSILQYADDRHIHVIPEIDMPGHSHAMVASMMARYRNYIDIDPEKASEFLLTDLQDTSVYISVQRFTANAVNPCINSTYHFIEHVLDSLIALHDDIQPLQVFHIGADEVAPGAWLGSPACVDLAEMIGVELDTHTLQKYFILRVAEIVAGRGLDFAAWEDGFLEVGNVPYNVTEMGSSNVYAYAWNNLPITGGVPKTYTLANADYKMILSHCTHLYFDQPQEPDPEEPGNTWARRYIDTRKTFSFLPESIYDAIQEDMLGNPVNRTELCRLASCPDVEKPENIVGIQGQLWSEVVRTDDLLENLIFPRLLALAERAWHRADWESIEDQHIRNQAIMDDWERFANRLGHCELRRLGNQGAQYWLPPPGARVDQESDLLESMGMLPGLPVEYSVDDEDWRDFVSGQVKVKSNQEVRLRTRSIDGSRYSRVVDFTHTPAEPSTSQPGDNVSTSELMTSAQLDVIPDTTPPHVEGAASPVRPSLHANMVVMGVIGEMLKISLYRTI